MIFLPLLLGVLVLSPNDGAVVPTHTDRQKAYLALPRTERVAKFADADYRRTMNVSEIAGRRGWWPKPLALSWAGAATGAVEVVVRRATDEAVVFTTTTAVASVEIDNLEIGRAYSWTVIDSQGERATARFVTEDAAPRLLRDPGDRVPNVRDLGGRVGRDGRRVKQGLVFRSAGLNNNAEWLKASAATISTYDPVGVIPATSETVRARARSFAALKPSDVRIVEVALPNEWQVARLSAADEPIVRGMMLCKGDFPEATETLKPNDKGTLLLGRHAGRQWAVARGVFVSSADGFAVLRCDPDYYWSFSVNGMIVRDYLADVDESARLMLVPVRAGENEVAVIIGGAECGFRFKLRQLPVPNGDLACLVADEVRRLKETAENVMLHHSVWSRGTSRITERNVGFWRDTLGIRSDIDLRSDYECFGMTNSPLESARWFHISSRSYGGLQSKGGRAAFAQVFRVFLDEGNYPIDFHCIAGQDRTGAVAFILNALLGVAEEELYLDWEATGFWNPEPQFNHEKLFSKLVKGFSTFPGATLNERVEHYVKDLGFTDADISKFREIMLEDGMEPRTNARSANAR